MFARNTKSTHSMKNRNIKTSHCGHIRINMQWIKITTHTVQRSLTFKSLLSNCCVRCSLWWSVCSSRWRSVSWVTSSVGRGGAWIGAALDAALAEAVARTGRLDLLVNNASALGPSPQPTLAEYPLAELARMMLDAHIHRVIVVDRNGKPIGLVSSTDILAVVAHTATTSGEQSAPAKWSSPAGPALKKLSFP